MFNTQRLGEVEKWLTYKTTPGLKLDLKGKKKHYEEMINDKGMVPVKATQNGYLCSI